MLSEFGTRFESSFEIYLTIILVAHGTLMKLKCCVNPFPAYENSAADDFERILSKNRKSLIIINLSNFFFGLFVFKSRLLQKRQKASI